eukprot:TRINITY_DN40536_c0_g1_i1.p1 TRINITY_DN40536_c0_g1~~TRINITY_DN40536_c0_g1_i1.p1  ORF type:complete len:285 (+),score=45.44 TRINITY_DN40536_c0_g1_i1:46-900(+)
MTETAQLRAALDAERGELFERNRAWIDENCLHRYLTAYNGKVDRAKKEIKNTLQWRTEFGVERLALPRFANVAQCMHMYWNGYDKHGHPILYVRSRLHDVSIPLPQRLEFTVWMFEKGIQLMKQEHSGKAGVSQWVIIVDERGKTGKNNDVTFLRKTAPVLFSHYVERLYRCYVVNPSSTFSTAMKIVNLFIDQRTRSKLWLSKKDKEKTERKAAEPEVDPDAALAQEGDAPGSPLGDAPFDIASFPEMVEDIGPANLETAYGGTVPQIAQPDAYWQRLETLMA